MLLMYFGKANDRAKHFFIFILTYNDLMILASNTQHNDITRLIADMVVGLFYRFRTFKHIECNYFWGCGLHLSTEGTCMSR